MKINDDFLAKMREATQLLQTEGPMAATAAIQHALNGAGTDDGGTPQMHDINSPPAADADPAPQPSADLHARLRHPSHSKWTSASAQQPIQDVEADVAVAVKGKGRFLSGSHTNHAGTRAYKLYIPSGYTGQALPLVVMLHGCTQDPDDFAVGTGMNLIAEDSNCFVVYPAQAKSANGSNCWNWFKADDQRRDNGEPALIAGITREIIREYKLDSSRVYIAGMSAGGAMAAVMAATYPELYAAVGIHSGLPYGVARNLPSALAAMKKGKGKTSARNINGKAPASLGHTIRAIVFHGDRDTTVHPSNGDQVLTQCVSAGHTAVPGSTLRIEVEQGMAPHGHAYSRSIYRDAQGKSVAEKWIVHGAGHAWSGGSSKGSYTDPKGPDATREMLRFFLSM